MTGTVYIRPIGLQPRAPGEVAGLMPLAQGMFDFAGIEVMRRGGVGSAARASVSLGLGELADRHWGRDTMAVSARYDALVAKRAPLGGLTLDRPRLMGIVNVTPDSFSDGGQLTTPQAAIDHGLRLIEEGAELLDIGGESTRPGSDLVPLDAELGRIMPVLEGLRAKTGALLSVDTRKAGVMRRAVQAGIDLINDVSALTYDPRSLEVAAESGLPVVLMHSLGDPKTMQDAPHYDDVLLDIYDFLAQRIAACAAAGLPPERLIVDPGIGFGKTLDHNLQLLAGLGLLHSLGTAILVGASRKTFIGRLTGIAQAHERVHGSIGAALAAAGQGVQILRVHDVKATRDALDVWLASSTGCHRQKTLPSNAHVGRK
ncbi:MAG: dihydropteroate synthase [Hyphomicrobiaceae bacterium]